MRDSKRETENQGCTETVDGRRQDVRLRWQAVPWHVGLLAVGEKRVVQRQ